MLHVDTERGWRGGERQALWLATALAARGHRSIVAARPEQPFAERARHAGLVVESCTPRFEFDPMAVLQLRATIHRHGVHVVHAHTGHAVALAALATLGSRARMVLTRRVDFRLRSNPGSRWKYARAAAIIAISQAVRTALLHSGISDERIAVVPSGVDLSRRFSPVTPDTLATLGAPVGAPLVVQVSQLVDHKDPLTFVRAIAEARKHVPELHAILVGDGVLRASVQTEVQKLGLTGTLHVAGYRTDADSLLAAADVVTLSSKEEGLGTVVLDAMAMGKPIAATSGGGIPEMIQQGVSGMLSPVGDYEKLGADIAGILLDKELAGRLGEGAQRGVKDFSIERTAEMTEAVYRRLVVSD